MAVRRLARCLGLCALLGLIIPCNQALAQAFTSSFNALKPALGTVVLDSVRSSTFSIGTTGVVTAPATSAITVDSTNPLRLVFVCSGGGCRNESETVRLAAASVPSGVSLRFRCSSTSTNGITVFCPATAAATYTLKIDSNDNVYSQGWSISVPIALDVTFAANAARGNGTISVSCSNSSGTSTCSTSPAVTFKSVRAMSVSTASDLDFGTLVRPASGAGTVTVSASGTRSTTGSAAVLPSSSTSRARFTVVGEGRQLVNVSVPATVELQDGGNTLLVTTNSNLAGGTASQVLGGSLGGNASLDVHVGGTVALTADTPDGVYSGSFTVTASYQ